MQEPKRIPLDPSTPKPKEVKKIPMPALSSKKQYPDGMKDDVYVKEENAGEAFWKFISSQEKSREEWLKQSKDKQPKNK